MVAGTGYHILNPVICIFSGGSGSEPSITLDKLTENGQLNVRFIRGSADQ